MRGECRREVGFVEMFVFFVGRVAASTAVATALEAVKAGAAAGHTAATAADDTPDD